MSMPEGILKIGQVIVTDEQVTVRDFVFGPPTNGSDDAARRACEWAIARIKQESPVEVFKVHSVLFGTTADAVKFAHALAADRAADQGSADSSDKHF